MSCLRGSKKVSTRGFIASRRAVLFFSPLLPCCATSAILTTAVWEPYMVDTRRGNAVVIVSGAIIVLPLIVANLPVRFAPTLRRPDDEEGDLFSCSLSAS